MENLNFDLIAVVFALFALTVFVIRAILTREVDQDGLYKAWKKEEKRLRGHYEQTIQARFESFKLEYYSQELLQPEQPKTIANTYKTA